MTSKAKDTDQPSADDLASGDAGASGASNVDADLTGDSDTSNEEHGAGDGQAMPVSSGADAASNSQDASGAPPAARGSETKRGKETRSKRSKRPQIDENASISDFHQKKLLGRRFQWQLNRKLLIGSIVGVVLLVAAMYASYAYNSNRIAGTLLDQADRAAAEDDPQAELKWLSQYLMLQRDDTDALYRMAIAADEAADDAVRANRTRAIQTAKSKLSSALARLDDDSERSYELRSRLIERLLQLGGTYAIEARMQVEALGAEEGDPAATRALAIALSSLVSSGLLDSERGEPVNRSEGYWKWLSAQEPGFVLRKAVKRNPDDLDLIAAFLSLANEDPNLLLSQEETASLALSAKQNAESENDSSKPPQGIAFQEVQRLIKSTLDRLKQRGDARSKMILADYAEGIGNQQSARDTLFAAVPDATERLKAYADRVGNASSDADKSDGGDEPTESAQPLSREELEQRYWDYLLISKAALSAASVDADDIDADVESMRTRASDWYAFLMDVDVPLVSAEQVQEVYYNAGMIHARSDDPAAAVKIWRRGLEAITVDSLRLLGAIAFTLAETASDDQKIAEAEKALDRYNEVIQARKDELFSLGATRMTRDQLSKAGRELDAARWRADYATASLAAQKSSDARAELAIASDLENLLLSNAEVSTQERIQLARTLSAIYREIGSIDRSAEALTTASNMVPENQALLREAGREWMRAGNRNQALKLWSRIQDGASPELRLAALETRFSQQLRLPPGQRDLEAVRGGIAVLRADLEEMLATSEEQTESENQDADPSENSPLQLLLVRLDLLDRSLPPENVSADEHLRSESFAKSVGELAEQHEGVAFLQAYAAERFASIGDREGAAKLLKNMEATLGQDSSVLSKVRARVEANLGDPVAAATSLLEQSSATPDQAAELAREAYRYAMSAQDTALAFKALNSVPDSRKTHRDRFDLYRLASALGDEADPDAEAILADLKKVEGQQGSYWRYIELRKQLEALAQEKRTLDVDDPRFREAERQLRELIRRRPRWGAAIALKGWLAALQGNTDAAIDQLRLAIDSGDQQISTRQLYWEQLIRAGRFADAADAIETTSSETSIEIDPAGTLRVELALRGGQVERALQMARQTVEERPDDLAPQIILAQACLQAAISQRRSADGDENAASEADDLIKEARERIASAESMASSANQRAAVASFRMSMEIALGDRQRIEQELARVEESDLPDWNKLVLAADALAALGQTKSAVDRLQQAREIRSTAPLLEKLVRLYRARRQSEQEIDLLRDAVEQNPDNEQLKNALAEAMVLRGQSVDWQELEQLLAAGNSSSRSNRLMYSMLLALKGSREQQMQAVEQLRTISRRSDAQGIKAAQVLAALLGKLATDGEESDEVVRERYLVEARGIHEQLIQRPQPDAMDLYRYAVFLMQTGSDDEFPRVRSLIEQLKSVEGTSLLVMDIQALFAKRTGIEGDIDSLAQDWAGELAQSGLIDRAGGVETAVGNALLRAGYQDQAVEYFRNAYQENADLLSAYMRVLASTGKTDVAADVAASHFEQHQDERSAVLMVDALLGWNPEPMPTRFANIMTEAVKKFPTNSQLVERVATWSMQSGRVEEAIAMFKRSIKHQPKNVTAMNNLAMAYTEIPGRAAEGLEPINQAIGIMGDLPELLDTKGTVLLRAGRYKQAAEAFDKAMVKSEFKEPRYQFHMILTLLELGKKAEARRLYRSLDRERLDLKSLTASEREVLVQLETRLADPPAVESS
jgi:tetratricopeptide (TPR) repeat protein